MQLLQLVISGIAQGCIYGLIALGFVLIYKATETVSFAQGELMMLGAFGGLAGMTLLGFPYWLSVICAIAGMAVFGVLLERVVIRPILGQPAFSIVMLTIGIGYVARGLITMIPNIGTETHTLPVPYKDQIWKLGTLVLNVEQMVVIAATSVLCAVLFTVFKYSKIGIAMQASSQAHQRLGLGFGSGGGGDCGFAARAHHVCACQHGFHRAESLPRCGGGRFWQLAGCDCGRFDHRYCGVVVRFLPARRLQRHCGLRGGADHAHGQTQRFVWRKTT